MLVEEAMQKNVVTIDCNASVIEACVKYRDNKVGCLIVTDKDSCVGIVTERDFIERTLCMQRNPEKTKIKEIMSADVKTIHPLETIEKALERMETNKIKKLPVVTNVGLVGIITITDIAHAKPEQMQRFIKSWIVPKWRD